nr:uroporphyrinogen decarboxylase family protein [uncultured Oscillibacter sp.]
MTSRERVLRTLEFRSPDRVPVDLWVLPKARLVHGEAFETLYRQHEKDIVSISGPFDHGFTPEYYQVGKFTDPWGSVWTNMQAGIIGEVKKPVFADYEKMEGYEAPVAQFLTEWEEARNGIAEQIARAREADKFVIGGWISLFERMQYLRGTEDLYCDIALEEEEMFRMIELVMQYMRVYVKKWLEMDIDAMAFGDDWGTQISLLISPDTWRKIFKPLYKELIDMIKAAGKKVFFHSDGYILELYPEFIELGVDAINSQLWCMGVEKVAERFAGKITFWGEISRQQTLPFGTPEDIYAAADTMKRHLFRNGGLIGQSEVGGDVSLENVEAVLTAWNR